MLKDTVWLTSYVLLAENTRNLIKGCQVLSARSCSVVYIIPCLSPPLFLCSLCCLSYSLSPSLFSITPPLFSPSLFLIDLSDPSHLKMCLFPSFAFKDVACVRQELGSELLSPHICDSLSGEANQNDRDLARPHQVTLPDTSAYPRLEQGCTPIEPGLVSKEESSAFN